MRKDKKRRTRGQGDCSVGQVLAPYHEDLSSGPGTQVKGRLDSACVTPVGGLALSDQG